MKRFVDWLISRAQRTPYFHLTRPDGSIYMNRWWLIPYNRFGIAARIHEIVQSDEDRALHDHPWWYVTIILRGGYWEWRPGGMAKWRGAGSVLFRRASSFHRLELDCDYVHDHRKTCWTLFITGPKRKDHAPEHSCWGFLVNGKKVPADVYLGDRYVPTNYTKGGRGAQTDKGEQGNAK